MRGGKREGSGRGNVKDKITRTAIEKYGPEAEKLLAHLLEQAMSDETGLRDKVKIFEVTAPYLMKKQPQAHELTGEGGGPIIHSIEIDYIGK